MKKAVLNVWTSLTYELDKWQSKIVLELTFLPEKIEIKPMSDTNCRYRAILHGVDLAMAPDDIIVGDGLLEFIRIGADNHDGTGKEPFLPRVSLDFFLNHPLWDEIKIIQNPGLPAVLTFYFSRMPLKHLFQNCRIGIDPGHGGKDRGIIGPVNLTEKHVALEISKELLTLLESSGAHPIVTRTNDEYLSENNRLDILSAGHPDLCVGIHTSASNNPLIQKYLVLFQMNCPNSQLLAEEIAAALLLKMGLDLELLPAQSNLFLPGVPSVKVKPLCLTYFADEANFRAPLFRKRLGQSIYNGIAKYLSQKVKVDLNPTREGE